MCACVCVCVRACVHACVRVCVRACMCVCGNGKVCGDFCYMVLCEFSQNHKLNYIIVAYSRS